MRWDIPIDVMHRFGSLIVNQTWIQYRQVDASGMQYTIQILIQGIQLILSGIQVVPFMELIKRLGYFRLWKVDSIDLQMAVTLTIFLPMMNTAPTVVLKATGETRLVGAVGNQSLGELFVVRMS